MFIKQNCQCQPKGRRRFKEKTEKSKSTGDKNPMLQKTKCIESQKTASTLQMKGEII